MMGTMIACVAPAVALASAQGVDVSVSITQQKSAPTATKHAANTTPADVVVWLTPLQPEAARVADAAHAGPFRLIQKDKQFTPHLLVVPTGASVDFPNKDPFFHNVFSLFNGKRFDLGLYESGTSRSVRFDREGVSYIFCNIHPEMGAVVLSLSTPFYGISNAEGIVTIHNVPPGAYRLNVWSETARPANPTDTQRTVQVGATPLRLEQLVVSDAADPMKQHKNKFGEDYRPARETPY
jgi:plastocyanin